MRMEQLQLDKKKISVLVAAAVLLFGGIYSAYAWLPLATGGNHSVTQRDVSDYRAIVAKITAITGTGETPTREEALKTMAITYAQYDLLAKKGVQLDKDKANQMVLDGSPLKGMLKKIKEDLGEDRYYQIVTLPTVIGQPFAAYYGNADPKAGKAAEILKDAMATSLESAAAKASLRTQEMEIGLTRDNGEFIELMGRNTGRIIDKIIDNGNSYLILQPKEKLQNKVLASAILVGKTPPSEFFKAEITTNNIPLQIKPWTFYAKNTFFEKPPVNPSQNVAAPAKPAEGEKTDEKK